MMNLKLVRHLQRQAEDAAAQSEERAKFLRKRLDRLLLEEAEILDQLAAADHSQERLAAFKPILQHAYQCPLCIVLRNAQAMLEPMPSENGVDHFRCSQCRHAVHFDPRKSI